MTRARDHIVSKDITPYYCIISRCVRREFLCGYDKNSKRDYEYRCQWVVDRIAMLLFHPWSRTKLAYRTSLYIRLGMRKCVDVANFLPLVGLV